MKLHVPPGPIATDLPYFDWEADDNSDLPRPDDEEEVDLTDLLDRPVEQEGDGL